MSFNHSSERHSHTSNNSELYQNLGHTSGFTNFDIRNSTLVPTAQEFIPSYQSNAASSTGAIKKEPQVNKWKGRKNNRYYGSGRTFHSSGDNFYEYNEDRTSKGSSYHSQNNENSNFENNTTSVTSNDAVLSRENKNYSRTYSSGHNKKSGKNNAYKNVEKNVNRYSNNDYEKNSSKNHENSTVNSVRSNKGKRNDKFGYGNSYKNKFSGERDNFYNKENSYDGHKESKRYSANRYHGNSTENTDDMEERYYKTKYSDHRNQNNYKNNWRNKEKNFKPQNTNKNHNAAGQRERLVDMINRRHLECLVCCEKIKNSDKVWSCMQCYHIIHLACVTAWAESSKLDNGWRCPACQNVCTAVPKQYRCYCGKVTDPKNDPSVIAHGCDDVCLRKGRNCEHKCTILCHPGPCPDCNVMVAKPCGCGSTSPVVKCCTDIDIVCDGTCNKTLECSVHNCTAKCHVGPCKACKETIIQECHCGKTGRKVLCTAEHKGSTTFSCENMCEKLLSCENHKCLKKCHEGPCDTCAKDISVVKSCPCGKTPLKEPRKTCLDPVPCCGQICDKPLMCGQPGAPHRCKEKCHDGKCPTCPLTTMVRCRCGHMDKEVACSKLTSKADDARCERKCTKKRLCGKHKCNQRCCIEIDHFCPLPCNHQLSCGLHRCQHTCHSGRCLPCMETSFEELYCECRASVIYPPVPCGTKPPMCDKQCTRPRPCGHETNHNCHSGPCPACFVLTKRWCYGRHEQRAAIPCSQETFSCGLPCGKPMSCGKHKCSKPCHEGECASPCTQPCSASRALCGHACNKPCHDPPCPESSCKQMVPVTCLCGLQKSVKPCIELTSEYRNIEMSILKDKMNELAKDQTVDISDLNKQRIPTVLKILECTEECRVIERNRRLAIGLQIRNPDISQKLTPRYSDFMRGWAKKDPNFCQKVHDKLTELVQLAKQSKQKSRSHSFESMNRDKRHFIHEYCEHFGVESAAYDTEPNRNVVATALKDKSWLPSLGLVEYVQRENGHRKVPGPVLAQKNYAGRSEAVSMTVMGRVQRPSTPPGEKVDYMDYIE